MNDVKYNPKYPAGTKVIIDNIVPAIVIYSHNSFNEKYPVYRVFLDEVDFEEFSGGMVEKIPFNERFDYLLQCSKRLVVLELGEDKLSVYDGNVIKSKFDTWEDSSDNFDTFLTQCIRAVNRLYEKDIQTNEGIWMEKYPESGQTLWEELKSSQQLVYQNDFAILAFGFKISVRASFVDFEIFKVKDPEYYQKMKAIELKNLIHLKL